MIRLSVNKTPHVNMYVIYFRMCNYNVINCVFSMLCILVFFKYLHLLKLKEVMVSRRTIRFCKTSILAVKYANRIELGESIIQNGDSVVQRRPACHLILLTIYLNLPFGSMGSLSVTMMDVVIAINFLFIISLICSSSDESGFLKGRI